MGHVVALAGGVGAARLLRGFLQVVPPEDLVIVGNVGDDFEFHGLHVSPDLDIVMYTLAGVVDDAKGWGIAGDTFNSLRMLAGLGFETWFKLGDGDLAVQVVRNGLLKSGLSLSEAVAKLCRMFSVRARLLPVSDDRVRTVILSGGVRLGFQEYFVKRGATDEVAGVLFEGCESAKPAPGVLEAIETAKRIVVCPSNPFLSVNPILSVPGVRDGLKRTSARVVGVSPIVGGKAVKGPAADIMSDLGLEASAYSVAKLYEDFLDHLIIDDADAGLRERIESLGIGVTVADTIMRSVQDAVSLASTVLDAR
jgi:LPPG:FO 2-phospho-L-lactate transferase